MISVPLAIVAGLSLGFTVAVYIVRARIQDVTPLRQPVPPPTS